MATTYHADLQKLYVAYFNRPADFAGLAYWEGVVEAAKGSTAGVSAAFAASKEYKDEYGSLTNAQIITKIYANLFNKTPDALGKAYWVDKLDTKVFTIDQIVAEVAGGAQGSDKTTFGNKVLAADAFTTALDTKAEQDSYSGTAANAAAKVFIAGITTDASLKAALAPDALAASVATVVKAGIPFTLESGLADLYGSHDAVTTFLASLDLDDNADTDTVEADVAKAVVDADAAVAAKVVGYTGSDAVKAAVLADAQKALDTTLAGQQKDVTDAVKAAAGVKGLSAAVDTAAAADASEVAAGKAVTAADAVQAAAVASYNTLHTGADNLDIDVSGTVTDKAGTPKDLIVLKSGKLVLATGVTETTNPGITAVLNAIKADLAAVAAHDASVAAAAQAHLDVNILDSDGTTEAGLLSDVGHAFTTSISKPVDADHPTAVEIQTQITGLTAAVTNAPAGPTKVAAEAALKTFTDTVKLFTDGNVDPLAKDIADAQAAVKITTDKITDLDKVVADLGVANANAATLAHLHDVIDAATGAFEDNGFLAPVTLSTGFAGATAGSDIFLVDTDNVASTISNFGLSGDDVLYVGKGYTLNSGALTAGNDAVLEVFLIQKGANVEVTIETKAFGSHSADPEIKITLTGVTVDHLEFSNGIITHV